MKNKYINISVFTIVVTLVMYLLFNVYTYIKYSEFIPVIGYFLVLIITLPLGLFFIFQEKIMRKYNIEKYEKEIDEKINKL